MEFQDIISSSLRKDMKELEGFVRVMDYLELQLATEAVHECNSKKCLTALRKQFDKFLTDTSDCKNEERAFQEFLQEKKLCGKHSGFQRCDYSLLKSGFHRAFSLLFGEDVEYFAPRLFFNMDKLEKQLNAEEFNEEIAMVVFKVLKNQLQQFITMQISMDSDDQKTNHFFTKYTLCDAQMFQNILISLMDSIEKAIAERGLYKRMCDSRVNERTMQTHEGMISKDASKIDNNVAGASHDKDSIIEPLEQEYFSDPSTSNVSSELSLDEPDVPPKEMPNEGKFLKLFVNLDSEIKKLVTFNIDFHMDKHRNDINEEVKEMLDIFESMERNVARTSKKNEILQNNIDQLLKANIANDVKNLVMQSYVEIKNKEEIERFSKKSKDVQSLRVETIQCDEVKIKFDFEKIETQNIELEHQVTSLLKENKHLKLTYQKLFDSIKKSRVQTKTSNVTQNEAENLKSQLFEFAETKFNNIFGKIELFKKKQLDISELHKESGEKNNLFENETSFFQIKIDELEKSLAKQIKENYDLLIKIDNLENVFADEEKRETLGKLNAFDNENFDFESKVIHLEKIIGQKSKDFDDVNLELSNRTAKFEASFGKLEKTKVVLERQLARKVDDSKVEKD
ncbi:hypothetical protein Tco_1205447 [Tanacetum coccineum]